MSQDDRQRSHLRMIGSRVQSVANDLKRTPEALAHEIGWALDDVDRVIAGAADHDTAKRLVDAVISAYPVALSELWVEPDDTDRGVRVMTAEESRRSSRIFDRPDRSGEPSHYYEYRDTAMSRTAPFKPEWIRELRVVDDADPHNADVAFNNGHLMHQTTLFVGPVNFYWELGGDRYCVEMETGDSNYITPLVPHSFTSRNANDLGLIVAVTYGGEVSRSMADFARLGVDGANQLAADPRDPGTAFARTLGRLADAESLTSEQLIDRLVGGGIERERAEAMVREGGASADEIEVTAEVMHVRAVDLAVSRLTESEEVVVQRRRDVPARYYPNDDAPAYELRETARTRHQPLLKGFTMKVLGHQSGEMRHSLHEYVYNHGPVPIQLTWADTSAVLGPGDSAYVRPGIAHSFQPVEAGQQGEAVLIRIPGSMTISTVSEYSTFAPGGRERVVDETMRWF